MNTRYTHSVNASALKLTPYCDFVGVLSRMVLILIRDN